MAIKAKKLTEFINWFSNNRRAYNQSDRCDCIAGQAEHWLSKKKGERDTDSGAECLSCAPVHTIALSKTRLAEVYNISWDECERGEGGAKQTKTGWRVVIKTKRGTFPEASRYHHNECGVVFEDALLLSLYLQQKAIEFAPKKRTTVEETDQDE